MITLKYYNNFLNESGDNWDEPARDREERSKPTAFDYDENDNTFNFEYFGKEVEPYKLKIFPQFDLLLLTYPDFGFTWCGFSALRRNQEYFQQYDDGGLFTWLLKTVMIVNIKTHSQIDSKTLERPNAESE